MTRRHVLLREEPLTPAEAVAAGLILPAGHRVADRPVYRPVYASTGWTEELEAAGETDWAGAALLLAAGAMQRRQVAGRLRVRWRAGDVRIPTAVAIQPHRGAILLMLDGE